MSVEWKREHGVALIEAARKTNARRDADERASGFAPPTDVSEFEAVRTAMFAVKAGLMRVDWPAVAEGYAMFEEVLARWK